jgi:hypothetical protein
MRRNLLATVLDGAARERCAFEYLIIIMYELMY